MSRRLLLGRLNPLLDTTLGFRVSAALSRDVVNLQAVGSCSPRPCCWAG